MTVSVVVYEPTNSLALTGAPKTTVTIWLPELPVPEAAFQIFVAVPAVVPMLYGYVYPLTGVVAVPTLQFFPLHVAVGSAVTASGDSVPAAPVGAGAYAVMFQPVEPCPETVNVSVNVGVWSSPFRVTVTAALVGEVVTEIAANAPPAASRNVAAVAMSAPDRFN